MNSLNRLTLSVAVAVAGLLTAAGPAGAAALVGPDEVKQSFKLDPKVSKPAFIDFRVLSGDPNDPRGKVKFKKKKDDVPAAKFKFGAPVPPRPGTTSPPTVDIEMVALSLVSVEPVFIDPFFSTKTGEDETLVLQLGKKSGAKGKIRFDDATEKTGTFDAKFKKKLKLKPKNDPGGKTGLSKEIDDLTLSANTVRFSQQSPITVTAGFCLDHANNAARFCLAPLSTSNVPEPSAGAFAGVGLIAGFAMLAARRRRTTRTEFLATT